AHGTRIRAGAFPALAGGLPAHRTTDARLGLHEVFGPPGARLARELAAGPTATEHRAAVEAFLRERLPDGGPGPQALLASEIVQALLAEPTATTRIADVARRFGLTTRALQRLFRHHVGLTPKQVLTRSRQHEAVERVVAGAEPAAALALELGYADQAHFTNAFRAATGASPGRYARRVP
ncbi:MAG: AraC family transcriptional regulator, partial [Conexibacter sp.]|nr:AraC family transcriptional regulator [Conexibacter sp.]